MHYTRMYALGLILLLVLGIIFTACNGGHNYRLLTICVILTILITICYVKFSLDDSFVGGGVGGLTYLPYQPVVPVSVSSGKPFTRRINNNVNRGSCMSGVSGTVPMAWDNVAISAPAVPDYPLISDVTIYSPVGDGIRLTEDMLKAYYPSVDGTPNGAKHLFMFAKNRTSMACCKDSPFGTDGGGCVCLSKNQRKLLSNI